MNIYTLCLISIYCFLFSSITAQTIDISGKVVRHNGDPLEGVLVSCTNAPSVISAADGSFIFSGLPAGQNYHINASMDEENSYPELSILDMSYLRDFILGVIDDIPDVQKIAMDVNNSEIITTVDLVYMQKTLLRLDTDNSYFRWLFIDANPDPNIWPPQIEAGIELQNVGQNVTDLVLIAVNIGDPAIQADHNPPPPNAPTTEYYMGDMNVVQGEQFSVQVRARDFQNITSFQQGISWDIDKLTYAGIESNPDAEVDPSLYDDFADDGEISAILMVGGDDFRISLDDDSVLYTLSFEALETMNSLQGVIDFSSDFLPTQTIYRADNDSLFVLEDVTSGVITSSADIDMLESFEVSPNPTNGDALIEISFYQSEKAGLSLFDINGKVIQNWDLNGQTFTESIDLNGLESGIYTVRLANHEGVETRMLVKY